MARKRHTAEQIILKLREAEIALSEEQSVRAVCKTLKMTEQTCYRWRKAYGGLTIEQGKKLRAFEKESTRLKQLRLSVHH